METWREHFDEILNNDIKKTKEIRGKYEEPSEESLITVDKATQESRS